MVKPGILELVAECLWNTIAVFSYHTFQPTNCMRHEISTSSLYAKKSSSKKPICWKTFVRYKVAPPVAPKSNPLSGAWSFGKCSARSAGIPQVEYSSPASSMNLPVVSNIKLVTAPTSGFCSRAPAKFFNQSGSGAASLFNKATASNPCSIAQRIPILTPPVKPVLFGSWWKWRFFILIFDNSLTESSPDPLSIKYISKSSCVCFFMAAKHFFVSCQPL